MDQRHDVWASGDAYEPYIGRWSRLVARAFLAWLAVPVDKDWLDVGCGTGALTEAILASCSPHTVVGIDPSDGFISYTRAHVPDAQAQLLVGSAQALPFDRGSFDTVVSGLVLNFVSDPRQGVEEMRRVVRPEGMVAAYVWDYADKMELIRSFWDAAVALNPAVRDLDQGLRFTLCNPDSLRQLFAKAGLRDIMVDPIDVPTHFRDFNDYWLPFLGGQGPAPGYALSLSDERRSALRERIRGRLPVEADGSIRLMARAWAIRGRP